MCSSAVIGFLNEESCLLTPEDFDTPSFALSAFFSAFRFSAKATNKSSCVASRKDTFLPFAMMLRYSFNYLEDADKLELSVQKVLEKNIRTQDIANNNSQIVSCSDMGENVLKELQKLY